VAFTTTTLKNKKMRRETHKKRRLEQEDEPWEGTDKEGSSNATNQAFWARPVIDSRNGGLAGERRVRM